MFFVKTVDCIIVAAFMLLRACVRKGSANYLVRVEFSQKGFDISIFGHTFYVHFSEIFRLLCKFESKNNKFCFSDSTCFLWA